MTVPFYGYKTCCPCFNQCYEMQNYEMLLKQTVCPIFKTDTSSDIIDTDILENKILLYICQLQHVFV